MDEMSWWLKNEKNELVGSRNPIRGNGKLWVGAIFNQSNEPESSYEGNFKMHWEEGSS